MLQIFKKEFVFELLEEVSHVDEEHVCDDAKETEKNCCYTKDDAIYFKRNKKEEFVFDLIDGQQRFTTLSIN